jgi:hypothetical protein
MDRTSCGRGVVSSAGLTLHTDQNSCRWLRALRVYLGVTLAGHALWEVLHLPLYTIWTTGTPREQAFTVVHCTIGDLLIALSTLTLALILAGDYKWPRRRFRVVAILTMVCGIAYTGFSEWLNVARGSWTYSDAMPVLSAFGLRIGVSPLLQWIVVPTAAFTFAKRTISGEEKTAAS